MTADPRSPILRMMAAPDNAPLRTLGLTVFAMVAFASNSILCRLALGGAGIDPASFTSLRIASGALVLAAIAAFGGRRAKRHGGGGNWPSAAFLFLYAVAFSFAYRTLTVATGALILFPVVQATIVAGALLSGERPGVLSWAGLVVALGGLVVLTAPGLSAPSPIASALMTCAGIAWGIYTLRGRGTGDPLRATARNFALAVPMSLAVSLVMISDREMPARGVVLAVCSGALASGLGYVGWYAALRGLSATRAATVQLSVPVLAAAGGVLFLSEAVTARLAGSAVLILGGVGMTLAGRIRNLR